MEDTNETQYPQELKDDAAAALLLCSWRHLKLCPKSALSLQKSLNETYNRRRRRTGPQTDLPPVGVVLPPVPALQGVIGRCTVKPLVKKLTNTDVDDRQCRLCLSSREFVINFMLPLLNEKEKKDLEEGEGIPVNTYDSDGKVYELDFRRWAKKMYVLTRSDWKKFYHEHDFVKHRHEVSVWMFRHNQTQKLCFVITSRRLDDETNTSS